MLAFQNEEIAKLNNNQVQNRSSENKEVLQEFKSQTRRIQELEVSTEKLLIALLRQEKLQLQGALKNVQFMDIIQQLKTKLRETRSHNRLLTMESDSLKQHLTEHKQKLSHHERDYKNERDTMKRTIKKLSDEIEEVVLMNSYLEIDITSLNLKLTADRNNFSKKKALLVKNFKSLETELKQCELKNDEQAIIILNLREDLMAIKENEMLFNETQQQNQSNFNAVSSPDLNQRAFFDDSNKLQKLKETINGLKSDWEDINFLRGQLDVSQNCLIDLSCSIESIKSFNIQAKKKSLF